jgi:hypothetical protein
MAVITQYIDQTANAVNGVGGPSHQAHQFVNNVVADGYGNEIIQVIKQDYSAQAAGHQATPVASYGGYPSSTGINSAQYGYSGNMGGSYYNGVDGLYNNSSLSYANGSYGQSSFASGHGNYFYPQPYHYGTYINSPHDFLASGQWGHCSHWCDGVWGSISPLDFSFDFNWDFDFDWIFMPMNVPTYTPFGTSISCIPTSNMGVVGSYQPLTTGFDGDFGTFAGVDGSMGALNNDYLLNNASYDQIQHSGNFDGYTGYGDQVGSLTNDFSSLNFDSNNDFNNFSSSSYPSDVSFNTTYPDNYYNNVSQPSYVDGHQYADGFSGSSINQEGEFISVGGV